MGDIKSTPHSGVCRKRRLIPHRRRWPGKKTALRKFFFCEERITDASVLHGASWPTHSTTTFESWVGGMLLSLALMRADPRMGKVVQIINDKIQRMVIPVAENEVRLDSAFVELCRKRK